MRQVTPFHTYSTAVPDLPAGAWRRILLPGVGHSTAAILLSEPHFQDVQGLLRRITNLAPHTQVRYSCQAAPWRLRQCT